MTSVPDAGRFLSPDAAVMSVFLSGLPPGVYEFRIPQQMARKPFYGTQAMYADLPTDLDHLVQYMARLTGNNAAAIYIVGNPVNPALLGRGRGSFYRATATAKDDDVLHRHVFYVDIDSERPAGINASAAEIDAAMERTGDVVQWLQTNTGMEPWFHGTSGSGGMLLYRVDMPNDAESTETLQGVLLALSEAFPPGQAKVDTSVFNAARLFRVPGTINAKSNTPQPDRPWSLVTGTFDGQAVAHE